MAAPAVEQRGTGDRGTAARGTTAADARKTKPPAKAPSPTPAPIGSCREFITVNPEFSNTSTGTGIHRIIREQVGAYIAAQGYSLPLNIRMPDASFAHYRDGNFLTIGNKGSGNGDVDLAFRSRSGAVMLVAEIKPANWEAIQGETQLANYIDKANANEDVLHQWNVIVFSPMRPVEAMLPREVIYLSRRFEIRWCGPGIILYKEIRERDEEEKKKKKERPKSRAAQAQPQSWADRVKPLEAAPRKIEFQAWVPEALRQDILATKLPEGVYRDRYQAAWPSGYKSNVVVWVKRVARGYEYQYYQEFPSEPAFYEYLATKKGMSEWQRDLVRATLVEYNNDLFSLISPSSVTGEPSSMSPYYARDELRTIYAEVLKGVIGGSARIVASGAAITGIANAMRQRAVQNRSVENPGTGKRSDEPVSVEQPLPDWVTKAIERGFEQARQRQPAVVP